MKPSLVTNPEVSLFAEWLGRQSISVEEGQRYSHPRVGANAGARMVIDDPKRRSDEPYVSLDILNEIVIRADHLSYIKLKIGFATIDNIPCLLEIDRIKFNTITGRMGVEAG